jgi:hypothetical protein
MIKRIYKRIAREHGVSVEEVERDMQEAIDKAYENPTYYARCVDSAGEIPTVEEVIEYIVRKVYRD